MLTQKISEINPDIIITLGPDGNTGHADHCMISDMTTEIILKEGWAMASLNCYKSQLSPDEIKEWVQAEKLDTKRIPFQAV